MALDLLRYRRFGEPISFADINEVLGLSRNSLKGLQTLNNSAYIGSVPFINRESPKVSDWYEYYRPFAWRGVNPTCVIEGTTTLNAFNYMVIKYKWALGAGQDLDTFTGVIGSGTELDNNFVGYNQGSISVPDSTTIDNAYLFWAGDNQQDNGYESILVNFNSITNDFPTLSSIVIKMSAIWYISKNTGNIDIEIKTYSGGTMGKTGFDITNTGGTVVQTLNFSKNIANLGRTATIVTSNDVGFITYTKSSTTGQITITY
jgi:hypothetical protein